MAEATLTRFGPATYTLVRGEPATHRATFKALAAPATLVLQHTGLEKVWIRLNERTVPDAQRLSGDGETAIPIELAALNTLEVTVPGLPVGGLTVRITQTADAELGLQRQGYFGLNTRDIERQRALYATLGFTGEIYPAGPETSTSFAQSLGFPEDYLIHVSLHSLADPPEMPFVDTVQFRGDSFREEAPYARLNHLGMTYATYATANLEGAVAYLEAQAKGLRFLSPPATAPNGERFVFFQDQDGTFWKLIDSPEPAATASGAQLLRLANTNMNVADLERSLAFYRLLGFTEATPAAQAGDGEFAAAHGFEGPIAFDGVDVSLGAGTDGATLQLRQWRQPFDPAPPYAPPVNHLGIDRINFYVADLDATVRTMNQLGFEQLGPIGGFPEIGIVFFFDPDGIKVQLAGPRTA